MSDDKKPESAEFKEGRYQLCLSPKNPGTDLQTATISQSGDIKSEAQLQAWFEAVKGKTIPPETHQWMFVVEGSEGWKDDFGADSHRPKVSERPDTKTTDAFANLNDGVANMVDKDAKLTEQQLSLLSGVQNANPDGDMVLHVQKKIILDRHLKEHNDKVALARHMKNFVPTR